MRKQDLIIVTSVIILFALIASFRFFVFPGESGRTERVSNSIGIAEEGASIKSREDAIREKLRADPVREAERRRENAATGSIGNRRENTSYQLSLADIERITVGVIAYNPPDKMTVGVEEEITVRIGWSEVAQKISKQMGGRGPTIVDSIEMNGLMRVQLDGGAAFIVKPKSPQDQIILPDRYSEWLFGVLPVQAGDKRIIRLHAFMRVTVGGGQELVSQPVLRREIAVDVNYLWSIGEFLRQEWKWLLAGIGGIFISVIGYFLKRWWERRQGGAAD